MSPRPRIGVLVSGRGSNLAALLRRRGELAADFACVVSNTEAPALEVARAQGLPAVAVPVVRGEAREAHEGRVLEVLQAHDVTFVVLAGYMRVLTPFFIGAFPAGHITNIHPSLLPAFPGLHAHRQALERGVKVSGATVHFVTPGDVDGGPILAQRTVPVLAGDDEDTLASRVLAVEHQVYADALSALFAGRLMLRDGRVWEVALGEV